MKVIPQEQVLERMRAENGWWDEPHEVGAQFSQLTPRAYFNPFYPLVADTSVRRAPILMGPRRVGKTVLIHHTIQELLQSGVQPQRLCYVSVDHPVYTGLGLDELVVYFALASGTDISTDPFYVFLDEIQYLKDWELYLKSLVDSYPNGRFVASGSAAAALRLKSNESGAGRFTDFLLPPLTFHEFLSLQRIETDLIERRATDEPDTYLAVPRDLPSLNEHFLQYLNFGGYPEVVFSEQIQADPARFIKSDIIDKVLLRDLPSLYGIKDIQELNYLFTTLAFNTANEVSLEELSQNSGVAKNTIKRYIEYLEAAFLVKVVHRVDRNAKRFQRATSFKVYLTNPSIRTALFSPVEADDEAVGNMVETGFFSQWFHLECPLYYARWNRGEVDLIGLDEMQKPRWAFEVKWSDHYAEKPGDLESLINFAHANNLHSVGVTTRSKIGVSTVRNVDISFVPASLQCYAVGYNVVESKSERLGEERTTLHLPVSMEGLVIR